MSKKGKYVVLFDSGEMSIDGNQSAIKVVRLPSGNLRVSTAYMDWDSPSRTIYLREWRKFKWDDISLNSVWQWYHNCLDWYDSYIYRSVKYFVE